MSRKFAPIPEQARVRLVKEYAGVKPGVLGTVTWKHPIEVDGEATGIPPYRVMWDGHEPKNGDLIIGMSDIGWLMEADEIEEVTS